MDFLASSPAAIILVLVHPQHLADIVFGSQQQQQPKMQQQQPGECPTSTNSTTCLSPIKSGAPPQAQISLATAGSNNASFSPTRRPSVLVTLRPAADQPIDDEQTTNRPSILNFANLASWWTTKLVHIAALASFVSVCLNTKKTLDNRPNLSLSVLAVDVVCFVVLCLDVVHRIRIRKLFQVGNMEVLRDKWSQFDAFMVICIFVSIVLHVLQLGNRLSNHEYLLMLRAPRPLILLKVIRSYLKLRMPRNRINLIVQRSSSQIYNVTLFFVFFMSLYGIMGVQFFGELTYHCVMNNTDPKNPRLEDLMIPDTYCSKDSSGYKCPENTVCMSINIRRRERSYNGFDEIATSIFTVYEAASLEGWVFLMYRAIDSLPSWRPIFYFVTMIFFLAWLVKNVFIAVIIETFAEIRVQFQQMWGSRVNAADFENPRVLLKTGEGLKLVDVDEEKHTSRFSAFLNKLLTSPVFNSLIIVLILANAAITSTISYTHDPVIDGHKKEIYRYIEIAFTSVFALEAVLKIICFGLFNYLKRSTFKFELTICLGTIAYCFKSLYRSPMTCFQVMRILRLLKCSPLLEDFANKVFGPGKKLGSLIIFTAVLLLITSAISMQLFSFIDSLERFEVFPKAINDNFQFIMGDEWPEVMNDVMSTTDCVPYHILIVSGFILYHILWHFAFMSMFQVLTQKGWVEVMHQTMLESKSFSLVTACYFILYHLFFSLIVLSMFVAVILDNLELDEDVKKIKQLKMREQSAEATQKLPLRLRVFERFADSPQMVIVNKSSDDFSLPKIRESFMRRFVDQSDMYRYPIENIAPVIVSSPASTSAPARLSTITALTEPGTSPTKVMCALPTKRTNDSLKKTAVINLVGFSQSLRLLMMCDGGSFEPRSPLIGQPYRLGRDRKDTVLKKLPMLRENGEILMRGGTVSGGTGAGQRGQSSGGGGGGDEYDIKAFQYKKLQAEFKRSRQEEELRENHPFFDTPLFAVSRDSRFRKFCEMIVDARYLPIFKDPITGQDLKVRYKSIHKLLGLVTYLEWVMIMVTSMSCISMMFEHPENRLHDNPILQVAEYTFVICMSVEIMLKVFAHGILLTPKALIRDFGGVLEMIIYMVSLVFLCWMPKSVPPNSGAQLLMLLRCLRPLRIFVLVPDLRKVVFELLRGSKEIILVAILMASMLFIFASYAVQVCGGRMARCNDRTIERREDCVGTYFRKIDVTRLQIKGENPAVLVPRVWTNPHNFNFDTIGSAMLALFEVLSLEGWLEIRDVVVAQMGARHGIFLHIFVFVGTLIGLTLFVGVVIANYNENKGTALLTVDQRRWLDLKGRIRLAQPVHMPPRPDGRFRACMFDIMRDKRFKRMSVVAVILNTALLAVPWDNGNHKVTGPLTAVASICTIFFLIEATIKSIALGVAGYWHSRRNRFEFSVTFLGIVWMFLNTLSHTHNALASFSNKFGYIVIVLRLFTICGKHATLKMLMLTIIASFYKSFFIICGMFLLMLVYAFSGVILFGCVKYGSQLGRHANFRSAPNAILLLLRIITGEDWNKIMHDCMIAPPYCTVAQNYWQSDCGNVFASVIYFISFYIIITYIVLNLLLAIIMENFSLFYSNEEDALLSHTDVRHFQYVWNLVDSSRKGLIAARRVKFLLRLLKGRLEVDLEKDRLLFKHMCYEIEKLNNGGDVTFHDVLNMLSYRSVDIRKALQFDELVAREELELIIEEDVAKQTIRNWLSACIRRMRSKEMAETSMSKGSTIPGGEITFYREFPDPSVTGDEISSSVMRREEISSSTRHRSIFRRQGRPSSASQDSHHDKSAGIFDSFVIGSQAIERSPATRASIKLGAIPAGGEDEDDNQAVIASSAVTKTTIPMPVEAKFKQQMMFWWTK